MTATSWLSSEQPRIYTPERLELEFSPAKWHANREETLERHHHQGAESTRRWKADLDIRYGDGPLQTLDLFPGPHAQSPCCVIIHGGFWRISDKAALNFIGGFFRSRGLAAVVANFDLCPTVTIDTIVGEVRELLDWVAIKGAEVGIVPERLMLFGHATGAHLAAMALSRNTKSETANWQSKIVGSFLLSGLYDLRQLPNLSINSILNLDTASALRNSPLFHHDFHTRAPVIIAAAQLETAEFQAQSKDMAVRLRDYGTTVREFTVADAGHFSILDAILEPDSTAMNIFIDLAFGEPDDV